MKTVSRRALKISADFHLRARTGKNLFLRGLGMEKKKQQYESPQAELREIGKDVFTLSLPGVKDKDEKDVGFDVYDWDW